jgi:hypothetical protein
VAILQVAQSQTTCAGQEQAEHCPAQAETTGLTGEPADHLRSGVRVAAPAFVP